MYVDIHQRNGLPNVCCCSHTISRYRQILIHRKPLIRIRQLLRRDMHLGDRYGDAIASAPQRNCSRHVRIAGKPTKEPKRARGGEETPTVDGRRYFASSSAVQWTRSSPLSDKSIINDFISTTVKPERLLPITAAFTSRR